jgi:uncharacterized protein (DUF488 family)
MADETPLVLYTIGHSNLEAEQFLTLLRQHDVTVLVDVRSRPISKYVPHFNKDILAAFLTRNGVEYRFAGKYLGGQPDDPAVYKDKKVPAPETRHEEYLRRVDYDLVIPSDWYHKGIARLLEIIRETPDNVAIMCSEGNPRTCHRHRLIARSLIDPFDRITDVWIQVIHILQDSSPELVHPSEFGQKQPGLFD